MNKNKKKSVATSSQTVKDTLISSSRGEVLNVGKLIPLNCGHNGSLSSTEIQLFEEEFKNSVFCKP